MKFQCDQCNSQYMVSDEKVGTRGVKVKCKKCSHIIIVRPPPSIEFPAPIGNEVSEVSGVRMIDPAFAAALNQTEVPPPDPFTESGEADNTEESNGFAPPTPANAQSGVAAVSFSDEPPPAPGSKDWYVAIDEQQVGPMDRAEVESRFKAAQLTAESLVWKSGMDDWQPLALVKELASLLSAPPETVKPEGPPRLQSGERVVAGTFSPPKTAAMTPAGLNTLDAPAVSWQPSAARSLSQLVQHELENSTSGVSPKPVQPSTDRLPSEPFQTPSTYSRDVFTPPEGVSTARWSVPPTKLKRRRRSWGKPVALSLFGIALVAGATVFGMQWFQANTRVAPAVATTPSLPPLPPPSSLKPVAKPEPANEVPAKEADAPVEAAKVAETPADAPSDGAIDNDAAPQDPSKMTRAERKKARREAAMRRAQLAKGKKQALGRTGAREAASPDVDADVDSFVDAAAAPKTRLTRDDIVNGVKENASKVAPCLAAARNKGEISAGTYKLTLDWTIKANGTVVDAALKGPPDVLETSLPACFAQAMRTWRFIESTDGAPVKNFPFGPITVR